MSSGKVGPGRCADSGLPVRRCRGSIGDRREEEQVAAVGAFGWAPVGAPGLQDAEDSRYRLGSKTPSSCARKCKVLQLDRGEGLVRTALFRFKK